MLETLAALAPVGALLVSILALVVAFNVELRNRERFQIQLDQAEAVAKANVKPLLAIRSQVYANHKGVSLENLGTGTAVINRIEFSRDKGDATPTLVELFDLPGRFSWDTFWRFADKTYYVPAGKKYQLVELSLRNLTEQGYDESDALDLLKAWQAKKTGINVNIEYEDVFGNNQPPIREVLR